MESDRVMLCLTTCADRDSATGIARELVERGLAACVSVIPGMTSIYRWQGKLHEDTEVQLLIKTTHAHVDALKNLMPQIHPYEVPELIVLELTDGLSSYLEWVAANCAASALPVDA